MSNNEKQTITFELPSKLTKEISDKITEQMKESYYWNVTKEISNALLEKMQSEGFIEKVVNAVYNNLVINEKEFIAKISGDMKDSLLRCVSTIANETVNKISERVKDYGFIKIAEKY